MLVMRVGRRWPWVMRVGMRPKVNSVEMKWSVVEEVCQRKMAVDAAMMA